jgi:hypothetical protein
MKDRMIALLAIGVPYLQHIGGENGREASAIKGPFEGGDDEACFANPAVTNEDEFEV